MQKIVPHLWYDREAVEAAEFYTKVFKDSFVKSSTRISGTPSGEVDIVTIVLSGHEFMLISAGPLFKFTPAVSFLVACEDKAEVDRLWEKLHVDGRELMPLGEYPFSPRYSWLQDKYGLSWQLMHMGERKITQSITPTMMFVGDKCGKAEEALRFYASVFHDSTVKDLTRYGPGAEPDDARSIMHAGFSLENQDFAAMDSAHGHNFDFNEAISFMVYCDTQAEIDYYWNALTAHPEDEQCGWLKDKFGFSWQVVPRIMDKMMQEKDPARLARVTAVMLSMKKFDIAELKRSAL